MDKKKSPKKKKDTSANEANDNVFVSCPSETGEVGTDDNIPAGDDMDIAYRVLENTILFDSEFIEEQKKKLDEIRTSSGSTSIFHEMPEENLKVAVVGSFSCGKSTFINSILDDNVAPSEITPMTHGLTSFIYGEKELYRADNEIVSREEYQKKVQDKEETVKHFIIEYPCQQLKEFEFMDSPGFASVSTNDNKTATEDTALSEEAVQRADVVFFLSNITEGTISGDAMERLKAISRNDAAENPHRRIFVILTWADRKPPKARETIRTNIINLCEENKLAVDGVMLYSSLLNKVLKSDLPFFENAKKQLFEMLVKLRAEGQEIKKYRIELKQQAASHVRQKVLSQFVNACRLYLDYQTDILQKQAEKQFEKEWSAFMRRCVEKIATVTFRKVKRMFDHNEKEWVVSTAPLSDHWFSDYYIKFNYKKLFLTDKEADEIKKIIMDAQKDKLIFPEDNPSFMRFFCPMEKNTDDSPDYRTLQEDICKEILLPMYQSGASYSTEDKAREAASSFCSDILNSFKQKNIELWKEYLTAILKDPIREATLSPYFEDVSNQADNAQRLLSKLASSDSSVETLNLDTTMTEFDVFSLLGLSDD